MVEDRASINAKREPIKEEQFTFAWFFWVAGSSLEEAVSTEEGRFYNCISSIVFSAFCIEAYLNQIGEKLFPDCWAELERRPHKQKLKKIAERLQFKPDFSSLPFQSYDEIFRFRNLIAHAKPGEFTEFERLSDLGHAAKFLCCTEGMINEIHKKLADHIETHEDVYGDDFFDEMGISKENPFAILGFSVTEE